MRRERGEHPLQTTAVVHKAFCRSELVDWKDRAHFYAVAAQQVRRVLLDRSNGYGLAYEMLRLWSWKELAARVQMEYLIRSRRIATGISKIKRTFPPNITARYC